MTITNTQKEILVHAVKHAGETVKKYAGSKDSSEFTKISNFDYGIPADKISEKILIQGITKSEIQCRIVSEESDILGDIHTEYTIYIDPIDGSVNFSRGIPSYCIGLAIFRGNTPIFGVVYDPNLDEFFTGEVGKGVFLNGEEVSQKSFIKKIFMHLEWVGAEDYIEIAAKLKKSNIRFRTVGSGILSLVYSTIGRGNGTILLSNSPWDIAPGYVFAKSLGIKIEQLNGNPIDLSLPKQDIIAIQSELYEEIKSYLS